MLIANKLAYLFLPRDTLFLDMPISIHPANKFLVCSNQNVDYPIHTSPPLDSILCLMYPHENHTSLRTILILYFHLFLRFSSSFPLSSFPFSIVSCISSLLNNVAPLHFVLLHMIVPVTCTQDQKPEAPPYIVFSTVLSLSPSWVELFLSAPYTPHLI